METIALCPDDFKNREVWEQLAGGAQPSTVAQVTIQFIRVEKILKNGDVFPH